MCPYCGSFWNNSDYGLKLIPKQFKIRSKTKKLVENLEKSKGFSYKILNKKQRNRAKWLKKKVSNHLAINCFQCKHRSLLKIDNSKLKSPRQLTGVKETSDLRKASVKNSLQKSKSGSNAKKNEKGEIITPVSSKLRNIQERKSHKKPKTKNNGNLSNKVVSKTQKQNSLLHLAALLQKQSKDSSNNTAEKRLLSFLK